MTRQRMPRSKAEFRRRRLESDRRWRAEKKRLLAAGWLWYRLGGGTWVVRIPGRIRFPCDTDYENLKTGEIATFLCTQEAYFGPLRKIHKAKTIRTILAVPGVKLHKRGKPQRLQEADWKRLVAERVRIPKRPRRVPSEAEKRQIKAAASQKRPIARMVDR